MFSDGISPILNLCAFIFKTMRAFPCISIIAMSLVAAVAIFAAPTVIYVAPDGDDWNSGTESAPLASLEVARDLIRALRTEGNIGQGGVTVYLRGGEYVLSRTFSLDRSDAGSVDAPVVFRAYPGESPRIMGGRRLDTSDFRPISDPLVKARIIDQDAAEQILEIDLRVIGIDRYGKISRRGFARSSELSRTPPMQLFIDGRPQQLSRWPNESTVRMGEILDPGPLDIPKERPKVGNSIRAEANPAYARMISHLTDNATEGRIPAPSFEWTKNLADLHDRGGIFRFDYERPLKWADSDDIWVAGIFGFSWSWSYNRVAEIDREKRTITLAHGEIYGVQKNWFDDFHHFENILEEIDQPGEYYIDRERGMLYYYPGPEWSESTDVVVSTADFPLWVINNAEHIKLSGLSFAGGRKGAVDVLNSRYVRLENLNVRSFTGGALSVRGGRNVTIDGCHIQNIGSTAITLLGGDWRTLEPSGHQLLNSRIHDVSFFEQVYNPAVSLGSGSVGTIVRGNVIHDTPHMAITISGNDHLIEGNEFFRVCTHFSDMGAIYGNMGERPGERGHVIRSNFFHNIGHEKRHVFAVYPDNQTMGWVIEENVFVNLGGRNAAINVNSGSHIDVLNNWFIEVPVPLRHSFHSFGAHDYRSKWKAYFERYNFAEMVHGERYPELLRFYEEPRNPSESNRFIGNWIMNDRVALIAGNNGLEHPDLRLIQADRNRILDSQRVPLVVSEAGRLIISDLSDFERFLREMDGEHFAWLKTRVGQNNEIPSFD
jgi:hypothetical protein